MHPRMHAGVYMYNNVNSKITDPRTKATPHPKRAYTSWGKGIGRHVLGQPYGAHLAHNCSTGAVSKPQEATCDAVRVWDSRGVAYVAPSHLRFYLRRFGPTWTDDVLGRNSAQPGPIASILALAGRWEREECGAGAPGGKRALWGGLAA